jgi:hypothetical protein
MILIAWSPFRFAPTPLDLLPLVFDTRDWQLGDATNRESIARLPRQKPPNIRRLVLRFHPTSQLTLPDRHSRGSDRGGLAGDPPERNCHTVSAAVPAVRGIAGVDLTEGMMASSRPVHPLCPFLASPPMPDIGRHPRIAPSKTRVKRRRTSPSSEARL